MPLRPLAAQRPSRASESLAPKSGFRSGPALPAPRAAHVTDRGSRLFHSTSRLPAALVVRAGSVSLTIRKSVTSGTHSGHRTALFGIPNGWITFCTRFGLSEYPAAVEDLLLWLDSCLSPPNAILVSTAKRYLKGVKASHLDRVHPWISGLDTRDINFFFRGHLRLYPPPPPEPKLAITPLTVLRFSEVAPHASHADRVFHTASSVLSLRGRRGGELFPTTDVATRLLRWKHFSMSIDPLCQGFYLDILMKTSLVRKRVFFPSLPECAICPLTRILEMRELSPYVSGPEDPIFVIDGKPLRRSFMMDRSISALGLAGIPIVGAVGSKMWRAGLASHSVVSGQPEATTQFLGIWASSAYKKYLELDDSLVASAVSELVLAPPGRHPPPPPGRGRRVIAVPAAESSDSDLSSSSSEDDYLPRRGRPAAQRGSPRSRRAIKATRVNPPAIGSRGSARLRSPNWTPPAFNSSFHR